MGTFVTNPSETLPGPKSTTRAVPEGGNANDYMVGGDYNALRGAANDLRDAVLNFDLAVTSTGSTTGRTLAARFADVINVRDFGAAGDGTTDDTAAIQAALNASSDGGVVDGSGRTYKITGSTGIAVPAGVTLRNVKLTAGTNGMIMVRVNNRSTVGPNVKLTGTGTTGAYERGIYPAADGVSDVTLDVEITNITTGVVALPTSSTPPARWTGRVYVHEIVGVTGASEGYGVLLAPANNCSLSVKAVNVKRHAVYLSAGAKFNDITIDADTVGNWAVQLYSTQAQPTTKNNTIRGRVRNVFVPTGQAANQAGGVILFDNCSYNNVTVDVDGTPGLTYGSGTAGAEIAIRIEGAQGTGLLQPTGNLVSGCKITGAFTGYAAVDDANSEQSTWAHNHIRGYGAGGGIALALRQLSAYTASVGPRVYGNSFDMGGANVTAGIRDDFTSVPTFISGNTFSNMGTTPPLVDVSSGALIYDLALSSGWRLKNLSLAGPLQPATDGWVAQGGSVYQGSGAPNNANGSNGDIYFRTDTPGTTNQRIYIKSAGSWVGIL